MSTGLMYAGANAALGKQAMSAADAVGWGLTAGSLIPVPGVANAFAVASGLWNTGRSALSGDLTGVGLGLLETGVGAIVGGYGSKGVRLGAKALGMMAKAPRLAGAAKGISAIASKAAPAARSAAKWMRANPVKSYIAAGIPGMFLGGGGGGGGGGGSESVSGVGFVPPGTSPSVRNVAPGVNFMGMPEPGSTGQKFQQFQQAQQFQQSQQPQLSM